MFRYHKTFYAITDITLDKNSDECWAVTKIDLGLSVIEEHTAKPNAYITIASIKPLLSAISPEAAIMAALLNGISLTDGKLPIVAKRTLSTLTTGLVRLAFNNENEAYALLTNKFNALDVSHTILEHSATQV